MTTDLFSYTIATFFEEGKYNEKNKCKISIIRKFEYDLFNL